MFKQLRKSEFQNPMKILVMSSVHRKALTSNSIGLLLICKSTTISSQSLNPKPETIKHFFWIVSPVECVYNGANIYYTIWVLGSDD